jgi:hypothetical protein
LEDAPEGAGDERDVGDVARAVGDRPVAEAPEAGLPRAGDGAAAP